MFSPLCGKVSRGKSPINSDVRPSTYSTLKKRTRKSATLSHFSRNWLSFVLQSQIFNYKRGCVASFQCLLLFIRIYISECSACVFIMFHGGGFTYLSTSGPRPTLTSSFFGSIFFSSSFFAPLVPLMTAVLADTVEDCVSAVSRIKTVTSPDRAVCDGGETTFSSIGSFASIIDLVIPKTGQCHLKFIFSSKWETDYARHYYIIIYTNLI